jgi:hypothetical protein
LNLHHQSEELVLLVSPIPHSRNATITIRIVQRVLFSFLSDFQTQLELLENDKVHIRLNQMNAAQQMIISRVTALEALQRDTSTRQGRLADALVTLESRQNKIENDSSAIQPDLSNVERDVSELEFVGDSTIWSERELTELSTEVQLLSSRSESCQIAQSESAAVVESRLSPLADSANDSLVRISIVHLRADVVHFIQFQMIHISFQLKWENFPLQFPGSMIV